MDNRPIGVFDSGLGGLTVVRELRFVLPEESVVYLGDTARVPYGPRSKPVVCRFARQDAYFLAGKNVKYIVVACNTASAQAYDDLREHIELPVAGVIQPAADAALAVSRSGRIGVIGTLGTIKSEAYQRALAHGRPDSQVTAIACPLFVPLVEEGEIDTAAARLIAERYLSSMVRANVDTLILGCTHYPLLRNTIAAVLGPHVTLIDAGRELARRLQQELDAAGLRCHGNHVPSQRFFVTDRSIQFREIAERFLGYDIAGEIAQIELE